MPEITTSSTYPLVFLRCRTIAFCAIAFFSFIWVILLCIVLYLQWELMDRPYQSILMVMLAVDTITAILLLVLSLVKTQPEISSMARCSSHSLSSRAHLGVAAAFAHWSPGFSCPQPSRDDQAVCKMLILYILISSWALPALILFSQLPYTPAAWVLWRFTGGVTSAKLFDDLERLVREEARSAYVAAIELHTGSTFHRFLSDADTHCFEVLHHTDCPSQSIHADAVPQSFLQHTIYTSLSFIHQSYNPSDPKVSSAEPDDTSEPVLDGGPDADIC
ncbi:hypothetical protein D9611_014918 [Ephemerocybe angulata]|uniref:Uncharacterized protein n=1 Tax=Ephemerocybe angulata TaxID=980116 RepID=A0A8H5BTD2_9AGAR|nr:hypothetical protein D9611_014918 [Tulosesus angulatus]